MIILTPADVSEISPPTAAVVPEGARPLPASLDLRAMAAHPDFPRMALSFFLTWVKEPSRPIAVSSQRALADFLRREGLTLELLSADDVARLIESHPAEASRRRGLLSFLRKFLGWLEVKRILERNGAASVEHIKNPYRLGGVPPELSGEDMERLMEFLTEGDTGRRLPVARSCAGRRPSRLPRPGRGRLPIEDV